MSKYVVSFEVECAPQDNLKAFRPDTVTARVAGTTVATVGDHDADALQMLLQFICQGLYRERTAELLQVVTVTPQVEVA